MRPSARFGIWGVSTKRARFLQFGMLLTLIRLAAALATGVAIWWVLREPKFDSWLALLAALGTLLSAFVLPTIRARQSQTVGEGSTAVQAGRDANVSFGSKPDDRDAR